MKFGLEVPYPGRSVGSIPSQRECSSPCPNHVAELISGERG